MEESLITLETAKRAKEKGFEILCFYYYNEYGKLKEPFLENGSSTDVDFSVDLCDLLENHNSKFSYNYSAPTQSLLQKWLREVHNIHVYVEPTSLGDHAPFIKSPFAQILYDPWVNGNKGISYTYEEALEFGLFKALKLI